MTIECSQSVHSIDIRPVYYGVQMVICGGKSRFHSVSTWFLGILLCKVKGIGFSNRIRYLAGSFTKTRNRIVKRTGRDPVLSTPCRIRQTALPALSHQFHPFSSRERPGARLSAIMKPPCVVNFYLLSTEWSKNLFPIIIMDYKIASEKLPRN